jgi:hypothetical protein
MSVAWMFVSDTAVPEEQLQREVEALGGHWVSSMNRGVLQRGAAAIYIDQYSKHSDELEAEERKQLEKELGGPESFAVSIGLSHRGEPTELAEEFGRAMMAKWGGVLRRDT